MNNYITILMAAALIYFLSKSNSGNNTPGGSSPTGTNSGPQALRGTRHVSV